MPPANWRSPPGHAPNMVTLRDDHATRRAASVRGGIRAATVRERLCQRRRSLALAASLARAGPCADRYVRCSRALAAGAPKKRLTPPPALRIVM